MNRDAIRQHIADNLDDHTAHIQRWVRQPSVSWDNLGVAECAAIVAESFWDLGCQEVEILEGRFHPGVWAYYDAGAPVTIHSYCMFDTRTVNPGEWDFDPWGAELTEMGSYPRVLVGRGAMGAKGPFVAFLNALSSIIAVEGTLPVNIAFLAEGEEIMGSPTYRDFIERKRDRLQHVDASYCVTSSQAPNGTVSVGLGLKGMIVIELTASGERWGGAPKDTIHSMAASLVDSPPFRLAEALASLTGPDGRGCAVDGLEEAWLYRKPLEPGEGSLIEQLASRLGGGDWRNSLPVGGPANVDRFRDGDEGADPLIEFLYGPTFNVAGLRAGFLGPESGTIPFIVPGSATAMLDMRSVTDLPAEEIIQLTRAHLNRRGFEDIELTTYAAFDPWQTPVTNPLPQAVLSTLDDWNLDAAVWPIEAGGGPWTAAPNAFGVPCVRGGAPGGGGGAVNEYLVIEGDGTVAGLADTELFHADALFRIADALSKG